MLCSKLIGKHIGIQSKQFQFNPDWDEDIVLKLLELFGNALNWTPPKIPLITKTIIGSRKRVPLSIVKNLGLNNFIKEKSIFSYAIPSPRIFNYTSFGLKYKSPLEKK